MIANPCLKFPLPKIMSGPLVSVKIEQRHFPHVLSLTTKISGHDARKTHRKTLEDGKKVERRRQDFRNNMTASFLSSLIVSRKPQTWRCGSLQPGTPTGTDKKISSKQSLFSLSK